MPNRRTYTDDQLREALRTCTSWRAVLTALGKGPSGSTKWVKSRADALSLDYSHIVSHMDPVEATPVPYSREPAHNGGKSGLSIACRWFLDRGYNVSIPLEAAAYDLVAESDAGLQRVQVKTTSQDLGGGRYQVGLTRKLYDADLAGNASGRRKQQPYSPADVDLFFIITAVEEMYLIPIGATPPMGSTIVGPRYAAFRV